ncbi:MAG: hypothetical protein H0V89_13985 [Deltaproteobacteria bacterium]|nr:hypothetical protein [Deltaproteobacteria bacterium]
MESHRAVTDHAFAWSRGNVDAASGFARWEGHHPVRWGSDETQGFRCVYSP